MNTVVGIPAEFTQQDDKRVPAAISNGVEALFGKHVEQLEPGTVHYEVVIVGSGYGGAIAVSQLAGCKRKDAKGQLTDERISVCVLERGAEYLPGTFPSRMSELAGHVRFSTPSQSAARGLRGGLFDVRLGGDVNALVANGLGGGSLINAGVMAEPEPDVFKFPGWPQAFRTPEARQTLYDEVKDLLGATRPRPRNGNTDEAAVANSLSGRPVPKFDALSALTSAYPDVEPLSAALSMSLGEGPATRIPKHGTCNLCGDCATGCNHGAKNSLEMNLLARASAADEVEIYTGATVLRLERSPRHDAWCLEVVHTEEKLRKRQGGPFKLFARKVILAAGSFGSTEILLRSRSDDLPFSARLGRGFSANGDQIAGLYGKKRETLVEKRVNAIVDEMVPYPMRGVGPTITGLVRVNTEKAGPVVVEELAIPGALKRLFEEVVTTAHVLHTLDEYDDSEHRDTDLDPCAVDPEAINHTSIFALMGHDGADGAIELIGGQAETEGDGAVRVRWPELRNHRLFDAQVEVLEKLQEAVGGTVIPNPMWRFVPESMRMLFDSKRGPVFTVHPLGGCPMGTNPRNGVVNEWGQVFDAAPEDESAAFNREPGKPYPGGWSGSLVVLDGSIVPTSLAINPALTISALALNAVKALRDEWNYAQSEEVPSPCKPKEFHPRIVSTAPSRFELLERLYGSVTLISSERLKEDCVVELTLKFQPFELTDITGRAKEPLKVCEQESKLRIYRESDWREARRLGWPEERLAQSASITADVSGTLTTFLREETSPGGRVWRALWAWWRNRGARDTWQWLFGPRRKGEAKDKHAAKAKLPEPPPAKGFWGRLTQWFRTRWERLKHAVQDLTKTASERARNAFALASHAGEVRRFEYDLKVGDKVERTPGKTLEIPALQPGARFLGVKRLTYARRSNPWRQLMEMKLEPFAREHRNIQAFPGLHRQSARTLELDMKYLGEQGVPLLRIVEQPDQPTALGDVAALLGYLARVMLKIHVWSFRRPDTQEPGEPQRLPGLLPRRFWGHYRPMVTQLEVDQLADGTPVYARLTNYKPGRPSAQPPVVMIHGYSTSGTTFAHPAVKPNLATHFLAQRRDVWILDLRLSSGMPTARHPWSFEEVALADIPAAFAHILRETGHSKLDVIAHCMGAAMFSMAVLSRPLPGEKFARERDALPSMINRAVLSQVGPLVQFSPANVLRSYVLSYIKQFLPLERYDFRVGPDPSLGDQLLDRLLASLPYPVEEFDIENPTWWMPWRRAKFVGTRHRMDALYARDMSLTNVPRKVLDHIDDLFGPLSLETVSQAVHFARHKVITNRAGRNVYVSRRQLKTRWRFPTLSVHGEDNELSDVATVAHMERAFHDAGIKLFEKKVFPGYGHQDSLIGRTAGEVFDAMSRFLSTPTPAFSPERLAPAEAVIARAPWIGPHLGARDPHDGKIPVRAAVDPGPNKAGLAALLPVKRAHDSDRFTLAETEAGTAMIRLHAAPQDRDGWVRLKLGFEPQWVGDAEGVLMLLLHDEPQGLQRALFSPRYRRLRAILRGVELSLEGMPTYGLGSYFENRPCAAARVRAYLKTITTPVQKALREALEQRSCRELEPALLQIPKRARTGTPALSFAFSSCQYPPGLLDGEVADASMRQLAKELDSGDRNCPRFLLLLGDQVYVDATAGLFDPSTKDDRYVKTYERTYQRTGLQSVLRRLPAYMLLDDHEIDDNFERSVDDVRDDPRLLEGRRSYWRFQRFDKFQAKGSTAYFPRDVDRERELSWRFLEEGFPFFMADTRSQREARTAKTVQTARIMEEREFVGLLGWLYARRKDSLPKFVATPAIFLPRHLWASGTYSERSVLRSDGWDGYPHSFHRLLAHIADNEIRNVVFLSGDEHLSCAATATVRAPSGNSVRVHSVHSSGLYAPFPFANGQPLELIANECFPFLKPGTKEEYQCDVKTTFAPPGTGYATVRMRNAKAQALTCDFHYSGGYKRVRLPLDTAPSEEQRDEAEEVIRHRKQSRVPEYAPEAGEPAAFESSN